jgi:hypothetical protein
MAEALLRLRRGVEVREGPSRSLVLTSAESQRALRVSGAARELLAALRHGATLQQCVAVFHRAGDSTAEQRVRVFLLTLQEAGVLIDHNAADETERRPSPRDLFLTVPISGALQDRLRRAIGWIGASTAAVIAFGLAIAAAVTIVLLVTLAGNPIARALANWSWAAPLMIVPWMCMHEAAHLAAAVAANATVVSLNASLSVFPFRLRTYVTLDPCTLPVELRQRLALPAAGPLMDLLLGGGVAGTALLVDGSARDFLSTVLTMGLWLTMLTLLPVRNTDVATMVTITGQAGARDRSAIIWRRAIFSASALGIAWVIGLTAHGLWSLLP